MVHEEAFDGGCGIQNTPVAHVGTECMLAITQDTTQIIFLNKDTNCTPTDSIITLGALEHAQKRSNLLLTNSIIKSPDALIKTSAKRLKCTWGTSPSLRMVLIHFVSCAGNKIAYRIGKHRPHLGI